jgi:hypothetical protein
MLLNDLLKLLATNFDINEDRIKDIINANNIKLSQRLLLNIVDTKNLKNDTLNNLKSNTINDDSTNILTNNNESEINLAKKKESCGRGRGRPRKTKDIIEETDVTIEVELVMLGNKEYYKTSENVLMNKEMEIVGILKNGKLVSQKMLEL